MKRVGIIGGGTPFQLDVEDPTRDLLEPTIQGTKNFLVAVRDLPSLEKVVMVASVASFNTDFPMLPEGKVAGDRITEADPPYLSATSHPYAQAKFLAHQVVNEFIAANPGLGFTITTVAPVGVMGAALSGRADSTSMGIQYLFKNWIAPNPFLQMLYDQDVAWANVDVADVAEAVYQAATRTGLHGRTYLLASESYRVSDMREMLNGRSAVHGPSVIYDSTLAQQELGVRFRPVRESLENYNTATGA